MPTPSETFHTRGKQVELEYDIHLAGGDIRGLRFVDKFGENPQILSAGGFDTVWDGGGTYVPPTTTRTHDVVSTSASDAGDLTSAGTMDAVTLNVMIDLSATFLLDGVLGGDLILDDNTGDIAVVTSVENETTLIHDGFRHHSDNTLSVDETIGDAYRVVSNLGVGASVLSIDGLDANFMRQTEFEILNGVTPVSTVNTWTRINRMQVFGRGTTGAVGTITATAQTDGTVTAQIVDGNNQTLMAIYTIPMDETGFLFSWEGGLSHKGSAGSVCRLRTGSLDGISYIKHIKAVDSAGTSNFQHDFRVPLVQGGGTDIFIEADSDTGGSGIGIEAGFQIVLRTNA